MNSHQKTIYLHIGMPKSGSTTIHTFLYENKEVLGDYDVFYPVLEFNNDNKSEHRALQTNFRKIIIEVLPKGIEEYNIFFKNEVAPIINNSNCNKIVFSDEELFSKGKDTIDIMKQLGFNVRVIIYLRKPAEYVASLWQECVKPYMSASTGKTLKEFIETSDINYSVILTYIEKLGKDNVIIRPFEKAQWKNENLIDDFLDILDVQDFKGNKNISIQNLSYNRNLCEFSLLMKKLCPNIKKLATLLNKYIISSYGEDIDDILNQTHFLSRHFPLEPKIIETISDEDIFKLTDKYKEILSKLASIYNKNTLFINNFPDCYTKSKSKYDKVIFNSQQMEALYNAACYRTEELMSLTDEIRKTRKKIENQDLIITSKKAQIVSMQNELNILKLQKQKG